jgi:hypothetical protein
MALQMRSEMGDTVPWTLLDTSKTELSLSCLSRAHCTLSHAKRETEPAGRPAGRTYRFRLFGYLCCFMQARVIR